jgi:hypothetical protein
MLTRLREIASQLYRFPAIEPSVFREAVEELFPR